MKRSRAIRLGIASVMLLFVMTMTAIGARGPVVVTVWTQFVPGQNEARRAAFQEIITEFEKANPGIKIKHDSFSFEEHNTTVKLAVQGGTGPDILISQVGADAQDLYFRRGLLEDLTPYAIRNGWLNNFPEWVLAFPNLANDKSTNPRWKGPKLAVIPMYMQPLGIYYNRDLFKKLGLSEPKTWSEFTNVLAKIKAAGITPFVFCNLERFMFLHFTWGALHASVTPDRIKDWYYFRDPNVKLTDPDFIKGLEWEVDCVKNGYFPDNYDAIARADTNNMLFSGKYAMTVIGNWAIPQLAAKDVPYDFGFFPIPMMNANDKPGMCGDMGWGMGLVSYSKHKKEAEKFISFNTTNLAGRAWYRQGQIPVMKFDPSGIQVPALQTEVADEVQGYELGQYLDTAAPGMIEVMKTQGQLMLAGQITPMEWAAAVQKVMTDWGKKIGKIK